YPHYRDQNASTTGSWQLAANSLGTATQLTWNQVWTQLRMKWVAWQLYARPFASNDVNRHNLYNEQMELFRTRVPKPTMDARLIELCRQAKANNVVIFGIAFEAPAAGVNVIRNCASTGRFFDVKGLDIR